jgi:hypothetical protein
MYEEQKMLITSGIVCAMGRRPPPDPVAQIAYDTFDQRNFGDESFASSGTPKSSKDFLFVDVDGDVVCDAVTAKHKRLPRFC